MSLNLKVRWTLDKKSFRQFPFDPSMTVKAVVESVARKNKIPNSHELTIYIPSTNTWLETSATLSSANLKPGDIIELKYLPQQVTVVLAENTPRWLTDFNFRDDNKSVIGKMKMDYRDPLYVLVPLIEKTVTERLKIKDKDREEFSFMYIYKDAIGAPQSVWLNSNISLDEQDIPVGAWLAVAPASFQSKRSVESLKEPRMKSFLTKVSVKEKKTTASKKRWCVLHDNFLFYFKSQEEKTPSGIVSVEYYSTTIKSEKDFQFALVPLKEGVFSSILKNTYEFSADSEAEYRDWVKALRERSATGAGKKVFGIPLSKVLRRKDGPTMIPAVMERTIKYVEEHGLDQEGIFRISGGAAVIEKYKTEFDSGLDVDLARSGDPHVAAGLLKLYLRELPEPLLTFDLYDKFIAAHTAPNKKEVLRSLIEQLPTTNKSALAFLLAFLRKVSQKASVNLMGTANLATVFAPNLLRPRAETAESMVQQAAATNSLMELMLQEQDYLFASFLAQNAEQPAAPGTTSGNQTALLSSLPKRGTQSSQSNLAAAAAAAVAGGLKQRPTPKNAKALQPQPQAQASPPVDGPVEYAVGIYDYTGNTKNEISFTKNTSMKIIQKHESGWIQVEHNGQVGIVPSTYVKIVTENPSSSTSASTSTPTTAGTTSAAGPPKVAERVDKAPDPTPASATTSPTFTPAIPSLDLKNRPVSVGPLNANSSKNLQPSPRGLGQRISTGGVTKTQPSVTSHVSGSSTTPPNSEKGSGSADDMLSKIATLTNSLKDEIKIRQELEEKLASLTKQLAEEKEARLQLEARLKALE